MHSLGINHNLIGPALNNTKSLHSHASHPYLLLPSQLRYQSTVTRTTITNLSNSCNCYNDNNSVNALTQRHLPKIASTLGIDRETPLKGTTPKYDRHILISTGKTDWPSRIEFDSDPSPSSSLARNLKSFLRNKKLDPNNDDNDTSILVNNSSYISPTTSAYLFPQNIYLRNIPSSSSETTLTSLYETYLLPTHLKLYNPNLSCSPRKVHETHILICTHNTRDRRCGIIGPILYGLFTEHLREEGLLHPEEGSHGEGIKGKVRVGAISHVGGHKYAGNVIVYLPPSSDEDRWERGGKGIWYGRMGSKFDVEEIVKRTVLKGEVVERLFRGGVGL